METTLNHGATDCTKGEIVMYQLDETIKLEVRIEKDSVWLNRMQMALLFGRDVKTIGKHINNALREELSNIATVAKFAIVQNEGGRLVNRNVDFYNLDMVLSVGYRVKSEQGIKYRRWSNEILKQYLLRGYAVNQRISALENKVADLTKQVDFFVRTSLPPVEGVFYDGQIFDAYLQITNLIKQAKRSIILVDNYIDESTLLMLSMRSAGVRATIYTRQLTSQQQSDLSRHNSQYPPINIMVCRHNHDRFLIIDDVPYLFGASIKDAGKKLFAFIKMQETAATDILNFIR